MRILCVAVCQKAMRILCVAVLLETTAALSFASVLASRKAQETREAVQQDAEAAAMFEKYEVASLPSSETP